MSMCPHCKQTFSQVKMAHVDAIGAIKFIGVSYNCPYCDSCLSVGIDHVAFGNEIVGKVIAALRKSK